MAQLKQKWHYAPGSHLDKWVFISRRNVTSSMSGWRSSDVKVFQNREPATAKLLSTSRVFVRGTIQRDECLLPRRMQIVLTRSECRRILDEQATHHFRQRDLPLAYWCSNVEQAAPWIVISAAYSSLVMQSQGFNYWILRWLRMWNVCSFGYVTLIAVIFIFTFMPETNLISLLISLLFLLLLLSGWPLQKSVRLRRFKSNRDEIWQDYSSSINTHGWWVGFSAVIISRRRSSRHFTQGSAVLPPSEWKRSVCRTQMQQRPSVPDL